MVRVRTAYRRLREYGWLRGSIVTPTILLLTFVSIFAWGFWLTGHYDVEMQTIDEHSGELVPSSSSFVQRLWATLGMFTGSYIALDPNWDPTPPASVSLVGTCALIFTTVTAGSLLLLSNRVKDFVRIIVTSPQLVVVGDGSTAAALVRSSADRRITTVLVTDSRTSESALATSPSVPVIASGRIDSALRTPSARRVIARAFHVVVATDSDAENMRLHRIIHEIRDGAVTTPRSPTSSSDDAAPKDLVVIHDPQYAELLRPNVIRHCLPTNEVSCPAENIAEHICHLVVAAVTGANEVNRATVQIIDHDQPSSAPPSLPSAAETIETWVRRLGWALALVDGDEGTKGKGPNDFERVPDLDVVVGSADVSGAELLIQIFVGARASAVATHALQARTPALLRIVVADAALVKGGVTMRELALESPQHVQSGSEWLLQGAPINHSHKPPQPLIIVVDPNEVGLDAALVTDDTGTQWARTFDLTYGLMFADGDGAWSVTGWQPGAPMGESMRRLIAEKFAQLRQPESGTSTTSRGARVKLKLAAREEALKEIGSRYSSKYAATNMLRFLADRKYELRRWDGDGAPPPVAFDDSDIEYIAAAEHADWLTRTWQDPTSRRQRHRVISDLSSSGANQFCYVGLQRLEQFATESEIPYEDAESLRRLLDDRPRLRYAANYNRRIAKETYPAIAAAFGYQIIKFADNADLPGGGGLQDEGTNCGRRGCPCRTPDVIKSPPAQDETKGCVPLVD